MLIVGYCFGIRSERRLCEEVHLNLGYRWFCRLGLEGDVPDHSTFSKTRHGRFRDADLLRELFETVVRRCMAEGLVGGEGVAVDTSLIVADAHRQHGVDTPDQLDPKAKRAVTEYLATLTMPPLGPPPRLSRNSSRQSIRRRAGPPPGVARRSTLIALIISLMWSTRLLSTWSPRRRYVKPR